MRLEYETLKCGWCGMEIRSDHKKARGEMEAHREECDGLSDPRERFDVGDRVTYSEFGMIRLERDQRRGEVVGYGDPDAHNGHCVRVLWDGLKTPSRFAHRFITHGE